MKRNKRAVCPKCGCKYSTIVSLVTTEDGLDHRKKICRDCRTPFNTVVRYIKRLNFKVIAVDFDGTLCENKWPGIGEPNIELINYIKDQRLNGSKIILWTCRTDKDLKNALEWCKKQGLKFDAVNNNVPEASKLYKSNSRKIYADEYIDDKSCSKFKLPFKKDKNGGI